MSSGSEKRKDAQIYVLSHEKKDWIKDNALFTPVEVGSYYNEKPQYAIRDNDCLDSISHLNPLFLENTGVYHVYRHLMDRQDKYVGINQHRRLFDIPEDHDFDEDFKRCEVIAHAYEMPMTIGRQYALYHNIDDLTFMLDLVSEKYPGVGAYRDYLMRCTSFFGNCCFVMRKEDFEEYFSMYFDLAHEFMVRKNLMSVESVYRYCEKTCEMKRAVFKNAEEPTCDVKYQSRILGYLQERLFTLYMVYKYAGKQMKTVPYMEIDSPDAQYRMTKVF